MVKHGILPPTSSIALTNSCLSKDTAELSRKVTGKVLQLEKYSIVLWGDG